MHLKAIVLLTTTITVLAAPLATEPNNIQKRQCFQRDPKTPPVCGTSSGTVWTPPAPIPYQAPTKPSPTSVYAPPAPYTTPAHPISSSVYASQSTSISASKPSAPPPRQYRRDVLVAKRACAYDPARDLWNCSTEGEGYWCPTGWDGLDLSKCETDQEHNKAVTGYQ